MPYEATVYRVLIASPSDLPEDRQAATDACHEWNVHNSLAEKTVLLPVKWESHGVPAIGHPQAVLKNQIVSNSDILVGMFWTKLGKPTPLAVSGTMEEIEDFINTSRPVLVYLSKRPIDPDKIDIKQLKALKNEKKKLYDAALLGGFTTSDDLKNQLVHHLTAKVRDYRAAFPKAVPAAPAPVAPAPVAPAKASMQLTIGHTLQPINNTYRFEAVLKNTGTTTADNPQFTFQINKQIQSIGISNTFFKFNSNSDVPPDFQFLMEGQKPINPHSEVKVFNMSIRDDQFNRFGGPTRVKAMLTLRDSPPIYFEHVYTEVELVNEKRIVIEEVDAPV